MSCVLEDIKRVFFPALTTEYSLKRVTKRGDLVITRIDMLFLGLIILVTDVKNLKASLQACSTFTFGLC